MSSDESSPAADRIPTTIGRYQITGTLGFGAMGAVYKAFDPLIKRTLAIKTIRLDVPKASPQHQAFIARFYQEARISGTLSHPNIVTLFDIGEEGGLPFLAMEFIDGRTIASYIDEGTRFKPEKVVALVSQVAAALDYAHSRGVVHRDIKPSNLMIHDGEKVKVTDFGIAKLADHEITHSGQLLGTPSYMSPEQAMGERLDGRSDIFSLGVCAFEMLSGLQPFPGANVTSILYKLVHVDPVEPADLEALGLVPHKWREVFNKVLAKRPENRYQTASEFVRDLEYCLGSWFSGLGEETVNLAAPVAVEPTIAIAPAAAPAVAAAPQATPAPAVTASETIAPSDVPATVLLRPPAVPAAASAALPTPETPTVSYRVAELDSAAEPTVRLAAGQVLAAAAAPAPGPENATATVLLNAPVVPPPLPLEPPPPTVPTPVPTLEQAVAPTEALRRPARPGLPVGLVLAGLAVLGLIVAAVLGVALWRRGHVEAPVAEAPPAPAATPSAAGTPELPPPSSSAALASGALRVESEPSGARVRVNGQPRGQTPLALEELALGDYDVRVDSRGYDGQSRRVALTAEAPAAEVRVRLQRSAPVTGSAEILSTPPGATVTIDGKPAGHTPLSIPALPAGPRTVQLELEGHEPWSGPVDVAAGRKGRVDVRLRALPKAAPVPTPEVVDPAQVYADTEVDTKPRRVSGNTPSYPSRAPRLRSGERVSVVLMFVVTETGEVQDVRVMESAGKLLDEVVVAAVRSWRYEPGTKRGTKVKVRTAFKQTFLGG